MSMSLRYLDITLIDAQGSPTTSRVMSSRKNTQDAIDWVVEWMHLRRGSVHSHPTVAIYIFDTRTGVLSYWTAEEFRLAYGR